LQRIILVSCQKVKQVQKFKKKINFFYKNIVRGKGCIRLPQKASKVLEKFIGGGFPNKPQK